MRKSAIFVTVTVAMLVMVSVALAIGFRERISDQQKRINQGIASGALTRSEADILQDNLTWIKYEFARLTDDGRLTPAEMKRLDALLDRSDRMIRDKKHNPITVFYTRKIRFGDFIHDRIRSQQARINEGIKGGELTRREADVLNDNLNRIRDEFQRLKSDGRLTVRESDRLDRMLDRNSEMIFAKKHNRNAPVERINFNLFLNLD